MRNTIELAVPYISRRTFANRENTLRGKFGKNSRESARRTFGVDKIRRVSIHVCALCGELKLFFTAFGRCSLHWESANIHAEQLKGLALQAKSREYWKAVFADKNCNNQVCFLSTGLILAIFLIEVLPLWVPRCIISRLSKYTPIEEPFGVLQTNVP